MNPVTFTPERWYMIWNCGLGLFLIGLFWASALWLGPGIIAKGLTIWSKALNQSR